MRLHTLVSLTLSAVDVSGSKLVPVSVIRLVTVVLLQVRGGFPQGADNGECGHGCLAVHSGGLWISAEPETPSTQPANPAFLDATARM